MAKLYDMRLTKFKEIKSKIPEGSSLLKYAQSKDDDLDVLFISGDVAIDSINLDKPLTSFNVPTDQQLFLYAVLVEGNVKAKNIYNHEDDGSTSLIVTGDITADNMVVGGQEIFVGGNLHIQDCFWGNYNHGDLTIIGKATARVFVATDEYHYDKTKIKAAYLLCDDQDQEFDKEMAEAIFVHGMMKDDDEIDEVIGWRDIISRYNVLRRIEENQLIIRVSISILTEEEKLTAFLITVPSVFSSPAFNDTASLMRQADNFKKLITVGHAHPEHKQFFEWNGFEIQIHRRMEDAEEEYLRNDYILASHDSNLQFFIQIPELGEHQKNLLQFYTQGMVLLFRTDPDADFEELYSSDPAPEIVTIAQNLWTEILMRAEIGSYLHSKLQKEVSPQSLLTALETPVIRDCYNDYYHDDNQGFWSGDMYLAFRQHGFKDEVGSFDIAKEIPSDDFDVRKYLLRPDDLENPTATIVYYSSSVDGTTKDRYSGDTFYKVFFYDWKLLREILDWYPKALKKLEAKNEAFLNDEE